MLGFTLFALLAAEAVFANTVRSRTPYKLKDSHHVPRPWKRIGRAPADHVIKLQIGVKQGNFPELERQLMEVSDPESSRYGQHLSAARVNELVKPADETLDLVHEWLEDNGVVPSEYTPAKDWITISLPLETVEGLLDTEYHLFEHKDGGIVARAPKWSLPEHLHGRVDTIQPTNSFFRARAEAFDHIVTPMVQLASSYKTPTNEAIAAVCNYSSDAAVPGVAPECFETLYGTKGYKTRSNINMIGFNNFFGDHPIRSDTVEFLEKYQPSAVHSAFTFPQITIAGGPGDLPLSEEDLENAQSEEANLDVQAIAGITKTVPIISYSTGGSPPFNPDASTPDNSNEPYLVWVNWLLSQNGSLPQVITTSYGEDEQTVPYSYALRVCQQFAQVGARGTSLLFSSGDYGVGPEDECISNDGTNSSKFLPMFPSSCGYVTTVGATMNFEPEIVAYLPAFVDSRGVSGGESIADSNLLADASGGGFSNYFPMPDYQKKEATSYIESLDGLYDGLYNHTGRGYPDISAQGLNFAYFWNGTEDTISGTSASTPLTGGIISLVNDALLSSGKPSLGFLNPWLYSKGFKGLTDIVSGSAVGCNTDGFPAATGWDPVTGLGTPIFPELVSLAGVELHY